jgi:hypothetical protein
MRIPGTVTDAPPATGARESTLSADLTVTGTISGQDLAVLGSSKASCTWPASSARAAPAG